MTVTLVEGQASTTLAGHLRAHGLTPEHAEATAAGMVTAAVHCQPLAPAALEALVLVAGRVGLEVVTGADWAVVSGARSRLSVFARPWSLDPALAEVAVAIAGALHEADPLRDA